MRHLPPLTALRAFDAAARNMSFKRAAEELGLTPTAISHQIRILEDYVGTPLFRRLPRPLALTEAGADLFPGLREGFDRIGEAVQLVSRPQNRVLRVTTTNAFAALCLLPRLDRWHRDFPSIPLSIIGTDAVLDLAKGEADLALRYARTAPPDAICEICRDRLLVVASPKLVGEQRDLSPEQIATFPLIEAEWPDWAIDPPMWRYWSRVARQKGLAVPDLTSAIRWRFREEDHAIEAAIAGQGIAICSDVLARDALADDRLVVVSEIGLPGYGFYAVARAEAARSEAIRNLIGWLGGL
ncbi:LysR substrate-binding domain-containing protein [Paragemmobacter straminiformis]|uniref:LysR family transcriptional regulator n=1 Tax=Paragemmobacter straminiformis TaxID=2045119 RepID=A0A842IEI0_9RHOB|nr:LysR substrate-binding domain-containing protein [Gemmobacter straminiformis]MBC2837633.1 LysR family transcriptional regulator [Gemmobacter straminiformis]